MQQSASNRWHSLFHFQLCFFYVIQCPLMSQPTADDHPSPFRSWIISCPVLGTLGPLMSQPTADDHPSPFRSWIISCPVLGDANYIAWSVNVATDSWWPSFSIPFVNYIVPSVRDSWSVNVAADTWWPSFSIPFVNYIVPSVRGR